MKPTTEKQSVCTISNRITESEIGEEFAFPSAVTSCIVRQSRITDWPEESPDLKEAERDKFTILQKHILAEM